MPNKINQSIKFLGRNKNKILLAFIFICFIFLRFYEIEPRLGIGNDQLDNAWSVKKIVVEHDYLLLGPAAKGASGFNIGPAYYYISAPIYAIFNLEPIAQGYVAGFLAILTFFIIYFVVKKIFFEHVALIAIFINTFSVYILNGDRVPWNVNLVVGVAFIVFYLLYRIMLGKVWYLIPVAMAIGFSLHVHFTSIFYFIYTLLAIPFMPRNRKTVYIMLLSFPFFLIWLTPLIRFEMLSQSSQTSSLTTYLENNYHGLHLRRLIQLTHDAFIEFYAISRSKIIDLIGFLLIPLFSVLLYRAERNRKNVVLIYLVSIWIAIPWLTFATYSGEISNYYFYITRPAALIISSYLIYRLLISKKFYLKFLTIILLVLFAFTNFQDFMNTHKPKDISNAKVKVKQAIDEDRKIDFDRYSLDSYLYSIYKEDRK